MVGFSYTPVLLKPVGAPPPEKSELSIETDESWLHYLTSILVQGGSLDFEAPALSALASKLATSYDGARPGKTSRLTPAECLALRDAFLGATAEDITNSKVSVGTPPNPEAVASWLETCRHTASFFEECAALDGVVVSIGEEQLVTS